MSDNNHVRNYSNHVNLFFDNPLYFSKKEKRIAFFLDRDGVLIKERHFISNPNDVVLEKGVLNLLSFLYLLEIPVILITNQSGISRKLLTWNAFEEINERIFRLIGKQNPIVGIFANGLLPNTSTESWRKPNPHMIKIASNIFKIDLNNSYLIGDRLSDLIAGFNSGINNLIHVRTGHGYKEINEVKRFFDNKILSEKELKKNPNIILCENLITFREYFEKNY